MSDVAEEAMDSSAVSEEEVEEQQETSQEDQSSPNKSRSKISGKGNGMVYSLRSVFQAETKVTPDTDEIRLWWLDLPYRFDTFNDLPLCLTAIRVFTVQPLVSC